MEGGEKRIFVFLGLPGSGKGTQAENLSNTTGLKIIGIGDLIREELETNDTNDPFLADIRRKYDEGVPQSDEVVFDLVRKKLLSLQEGVILDNFPFSSNQTKFLKDLIAEHSWPKPVLIYLKVDPESVVKRIVYRKVCSECGSIHTAAEGTICEECGGALVSRADDNEETVRTRIDFYLPRINEVLELFGEFGRVVEIDGEPKPEIVWQTIQNEVASALHKVN